MEVFAVLASVQSMGMTGIQGYPVTVEAYCVDGLPMFEIVGLPDAAVKESRERVRAAMSACHTPFPVARLTLNLAPADVRKEGSVYDLPLLLALLKASGQLTAGLEDSAFLGELSLTGEIRPVRGTPFDFESPKPIGRDLDAADPQLRLGGGYDHNFVLQGSGLKQAAAVSSPLTGIAMECHTTMPGIQFYTANCLHNPKGKSGPMGPRQGFCLETQFFPDSPNHPSFPSAVLRAGEAFRSVTEYRFT